MELNENNAPKYVIGRKYSRSTLKSMTKDDLINLIEIAQSNYSGVNLILYNTRKYAEKIDKALDKACKYMHFNGINGCPYKYDCELISDDKFKKQCVLCDWNYNDIDSEINNNQYQEKSIECWKEYFLNKE